VVWALIQEPTRRLEWDARITRCDLLTPRPLGKGLRLRNTYRLFGLPMWIEIETVSWQPPVRSGVRTVAISPGPLRSISGSWQFHLNADGSTNWLTQLVVRGAGGRFLAPLLGRVLGELMLRPLTVISARNLKRLAEAEYAAHRNGASLGRPVPAIEPIAASPTGAVAAMGA
jgi:hypothetical protein